MEYDIKEKLESIWDGFQDNIYALRNSLRFYIDNNEVIKEDLFKEKIKSVMSDINENIQELFEYMDSMDSPLFTNSDGLSGDPDKVLLK